MRAHPLLALAGALALASLTACGSDGSSDPSALTVTSTDTACTVSEKDLAAGTHTFRLVNSGSQVTEVYFYGPDGKIISEKENIGPGTNYDITVTLAAGDQRIVCKPGMTGDGIGQDVKVSGEAAALDPRLAKAVADYRLYIDRQVADTLEKTKRFTAKVKSGDVEEAKALYAPSRVGWESVEPVAESFGDLDPRIDAREADLTAEEKAGWGGWHRLEKALWTTGSTEGLDEVADRLVTDLEDLQGRVHTVDITPASMANGAKELLDEVATGKITGEEEAFSHTDLVDFKANLDGAAEVFELLEPVVAEKDAALAARLGTAFKAVYDALDEHRDGDTYVSYDTVEEPGRKKLSDVVNTLAEPLSKLAAAVG